MSVEFCHLQSKFFEIEWCISLIDIFWQCSAVSAIVRPHWDRFSFSSLLCAFGFDWCSLPPYSALLIIHWDPECLRNYLILSLKFLFSYENGVAVIYVEPCMIWGWMNHEIQKKIVKWQKLHCKPSWLKYQMGRAGLKIYYGLIYYKQPFQS